MDDDIKIIKHGRCYNRVVRFECFNCGCVYETADASFRAVFGRVTYRSCCPECQETNVMSMDASEVTQDGRTETHD